jgi:hypothetical protein
MTSDGARAIERCARNIAGRQGLEARATSSRRRADEALGVADLVARVRVVRVCSATVLEPSRIDPRNLLLRVIVGRQDLDPVQDHRVLVRSRRVLTRTDQDCVVFEGSPGGTGTPNIRDHRIHRVRGPLTVERREVEVQFVCVPRAVRQHVGEEPDRAVPNDQRGIDSRAFSISTRSRIPTGRKCLRGRRASLKMDQRRICRDRGTRRKNAPSEQSSTNRHAHPTPRTIEVLGSDRRPSSEYLSLRRGRERPRAFG